MIKLARRQQDKEISKARRDMQWQRQFSLAIDPERAKEIYEKRNSPSAVGCSMCGAFCANNILDGVFRDALLGTEKE